MKNGKCESLKSVDHNPSCSLAKIGDSHRAGPGMRPDHAAQLDAVEMIHMPLPQTAAVSDIILKELIGLPREPQKYRHRIVYTVPANLFNQEIVGFSGSSRLAQDRDFAVFDRDDRLDVQHFSRHRSGARDPAALFQVFEGVDHGDQGDLIKPSISKGAWIDKTITGVEIPEAGNVTLVKGGNNTIDCYDIIIAIRTGDITVPAAITAAGWATLYTNCPLDFSGVEGLTAYTATLDGSTVTLTEVDDVPANTGVVLKGAANTYEIPAIASSETAKGSLEGSATAINVKEDALNVYYVLAKNGDEDARFAKVTSGTIAAGKAFLKVAKNGARESYSIGGVAPTAIESIQALQENGELFNLNGQRVAAPQKGLYIVNGKKVIMK